MINFTLQVFLYLIFEFNVGEKKGKVTNERMESWLQSIR